MKSIDDEISPQKQLTRIGQISAAFLFLLLCWIPLNLGMQVVTNRLIEGDQLLQLQVEQLNEIYEDIELLLSLNPEISVNTVRRLVPDIVEKLDALGKVVAEGMVFRSQSLWVLQIIGNRTTDIVSMGPDSLSMLAFNGMGAIMRNAYVDDDLERIYYLAPADMSIIKRRAWVMHYRAQRTAISTALLRLLRFQRIYTPVSASLILLVFLLLYFKGIRPGIRNILNTIESDRRDVKIRGRLTYLIGEAVDRMSGPLIDAHEYSKWLNKKISTEPAFTEYRFRLLPAEQVKSGSQANSRDIFASFSLRPDTAERLALKLPSSDQHRPIDFSAYLDILSSLERLRHERELRQVVESERDRFLSVSWHAINFLSSPVMVVNNAEIVEAANDAMLELLKVDSHATLFRIPVSKVEAIHIGVLDPEHPVVNSIFDEQHGSSHDAIHYANGTILRWTCSRVEGMGRIHHAQDVTELMSDIAERERRQQLEHLGRIVGTIAHDVNNFLAVISGSAQLLDEAEIGTNSKETVQTILHTTNQATLLNRKLLMSTRRTNLRPESFKVESIQRDCTEFLQRMYPAIKFHFQVSKEAVIWADRAYLVASVFNLFNNCGKAMQGEGTIVMSCVIQDDMLRIRVEDDGPGFSDSALANGLDYFYTESSVGTGMGLASVASFARLSNGRVELFNRDEGGAGVDLYLPLSRKSRETKEPKADYSESAGNDSENNDAMKSAPILVVEDNADLRKLIHIFLTRSDYETLLASSIREARELLAQLDSPVGLIISDIVLPDGNGVQLVEELLEQYEEIKAIFITGFANQYLQFNANEDRVEVMEKPMLMQDLVLRVNSCYVEHP